ncbi:hypothetical protein BRY75_13820 [Acinetobacter baumannii]|uniref:hypothetical protein n=1 Tax=Acinetobacter baumannii TaxID=470 RepID=UPI00092B7687|nr:hypothetical protein [Acinetobacter baumannii]OJK06377.1 hypothetical protein BRY75_13820 [Acinetobacter baumannii]
MKQDYLEESISFFSENSNRELEFFWVYFRPDLEPNIQYNYDNPTSPLLPPLEKIKIDLTDLFNKFNDLEALLIQIKKLKINRILELNHISWIDHKNERQLNFVFSKIQNEFKELTINNSFDTTIKVQNNRYFDNILKFKIPQKQDEKNLKTEDYTFTPTSYQINISIPLPLPKKISGNKYEILIYNIDLLNINLEKKLKLLEKIREQWEISIKQNDKYYNWIDSNNIEQIKWIFNYLEKKGMYIQHSFYFNEENFTPYNKLLIILDNINNRIFFQEEFSIFKFFEKIKKSWSQQNYRNSGKLRKPYHLPLTKNTQTKLEKLAELKNTKKENIIEELIDQEYSKYTDSNGKFKY